MERNAHRINARPPYLNRDRQGPSEIGAMADLQRLLFETPARVGDKEILVAARLSARVKAFAGHEISEDLMDHINERSPRKRTGSSRKACCAPGRIGWRPSSTGVFTWRSAAVPCSSSAAS